MVGVLWHLKPTVKAAKGKANRSSATGGTKGAGSAKQAVAKAQPKTTKATGVVPHSGRKVGKTPIKDKGKGIQPYNQKSNPYGTGSGKVVIA